MQDKQSNLKFLQAIQEKKFNLAYQIGQQILMQNPNEQSIRRFMIFLSKNLDDIKIIFINVNQQFESDDEAVENEDDEVKPFKKKMKLSQQQKNRAPSQERKPIKERTINNKTNNFQLFQDNQKQSLKSSSMKTFQIKTQTQLEQRIKNIESKNEKIALPFHQISFPQLRLK